MESFAPPNPTTNMTGGRSLDSKRSHWTICWNSPIIGKGEGFCAFYNTKVYFNNKTKIYIQKRQKEISTWLILRSWLAQKMQCKDQNYEIFQKQNLMDPSSQLAPPQCFAHPLASSPSSGAVVPIYSFTSPWSRPSWDRPAQNSQEWRGKCKSTYQAKKSATSKEIDI